MIEVTPAWTLIAECGRLALDGFVALRTRDIVQVRRRGSHDLTVRWLQRHGPWPPPEPRGELSLTDVRSLVESVNTHYHLISVFEEDLNPGAVYIGTPVRTGKKRPAARGQPESPLGRHTVVLPLRRHHPHRLRRPVQHGPARVGRTAAGRVAADRRP